MWKAWSAVFIAVASFAASLYLISICPAPLLPFAWALSGTALTGVSNIGIRSDSNSCDWEEIYLVRACYGEVSL